MIKKNVAIILTLLFLAAGPAAQPPQNLSDLESSYRNRVDAAKRAYHDEMVKANGDLQTGLLKLGDRAAKSQDAEAAKRIQKKIDYLTEETSHGSFAAGPGPVQKPDFADIDLGALDLTQKQFFGVGGTGNKIVYLCDASGSMLSIFGTLKQQLKTSIDRLDSVQEINVIFYCDDNCFTLFKDGTHKLTDDNKKLAFDFIDNAICTGATQPMPAIKIAIAEKPDMIFFVTDDIDQINNFDDVTDAFKNGIPNGKTQVNCIFLESDPDPKLEKTLKKIADENHGTFQKIKKVDM